MDETAKQFCQQTTAAFYKMTARLDLIDSGDLKKRGLNLQLLKETLKNVAPMIGEAQQVIENHANGTLVVDEGTLQATARLLNAAKNAIDEIILAISTAQMDV